MSAVLSELRNCSYAGKCFYGRRAGNLERRGSRRLPARQVVFLLMAFAAWFGVAQAADVLTIPFVNKTGLDTNRYTIYALGYSTGRADPSHVAPVVLSVTGSKGVASFMPYSQVFGTNTSGYIPSYKIGDEIKSISVNLDKDKIAGARVFFLCGG